MRQGYKRACLIGLLAGLVAAVPASAAELLWSTTWSNWTTVESTVWTTPPQNVEAADDFDVQGTIEQILVGGDNACIATCSPPPVSGVWVRFLAWDAGQPGATQYEIFIPAGDPGFVYNASSPDTLDITLPTPFEATGQHFLSVQLVFDDAFFWSIWVANHGAPAGSHLWVRDNLAGGGWFQPVDVLQDPLNDDLYFSLYGTPAGGIDPPPPVAGCGQWTDRITPNPAGASDARLNGVDVISPWDVWAVGSYDGPVEGYWNDRTQSLAMHWNGTDWSIVPSPSPSPSPSTTQVDLEAVSGSVTNNVWAVGRKKDQDAGGYTGGRVLAMRWDGLSWEEMNPPWPANNDGSVFTGASGEQLFDVVALAEDEVWMVGSYWHEEPSGVIYWPGVAMRWSGSDFDVFELPLVSPQGNQQAGAIAAVSSDDIWAVGSGDGPSAPAYIWHWDGSSWANVPGPTPGVERWLSAVVALATDDVWAGGSYRDELYNVFPLILHWDGTSWSEVPTPAGGNILAARAANDIFTAGVDGYAHWNGSTWTAESGPEYIPWAGVADLDFIGPCSLWGVGLKTVASEYATYAVTLDPIGGNGDLDGDGVGDAQDNCPADANPDQADCDLDGAGDVCELISGTAVDCNGNLVPDNCDSFADCNANDVPDECEPDCNANGLPDACDIAAATSLDCEPNGIPDECEVFADCNLNGTNDACDINGGGSADTNANGFPDECETLGPDVATVNTIEDVVDFGGGQRMPALPGPDGLVSFREAVIAVNNTPGPQTIAFNIPPGDWGGGGPEFPELRLENGLYLLNDDGTTVDFTTQTKFTGDTNPDGAEVGIYGFEPNAWGVAAIYINGNDCTVKGLGRVLQRGYGVQIRGNDNRVIGSTIYGPFYAGVYITGGFEGPVSTGNVVGGVQPGEGNVLVAGNSGVRVDGPASDNVIVGNLLDGSYAGVEIRGAAVNTRIGGPTLAERNVIAGAGHFGEEGFPVGDQINLWNAVGTLIEGNYIGTRPDGLSAEPQTGPDGIEIRDSVDTVVRGNLIGGLLGAGGQNYSGQFFGKAINVLGNSSGTTIQGNLIGTDATGANPIPNATGIAVASFPASEIPTSTLIGGASPGQPNVIAHSSKGPGVRVGFNVTGATVSANAIFDNDGLGIDLGGSGNGGQFAPTLTSVQTDGFNLTIIGNVTGTSNAAYTVEFFSNPACDPSGSGEGQSFLGSAAVVTDGSGSAALNLVLAAPVPQGAFVTATATEASSGNTSEFSVCAVATLAACTSTPGEVAALQVDGTMLSWFDYGSGITYDLARGELQGLATGQPALCAQSGIAAAQFEDFETPLTGEVYYYLVRAVNGCGAGPWGQGNGGERSTMCP